MGYKHADLMLQYVENANKSLSEFKESRGANES